MMTQRQQQRQRRRRWRALLLALTAVAIADSRALVAGASGSGDDGDDDDTGPVSAAMRAGAKALADTLQATGDAVLVREFDKFWSGNVLCSKGPFVLSKDGPSNQNCMEALNARGLSCTCLDRFSKRSIKWEFRVTKKSKTTGTSSKAIDSTTALAITKIAPFALTKPVEELSIIGDGTEPAAIEFVEDFDVDGSKASPKLESSSSSKATLKRVHIENIAMDSAVRESGFFKTTLTELTLKNCGLKGGSLAFLKSLSSLTILNLERNTFTSIPSEMLLLPGLQQVFLAGNSITNATVTEKEYQMIKAMKVFNMDPQVAAASDCTGALMPAQNLQFCVSDMKPQANVPEVSNTGTSKYLLIGAIVGSVVVVILIFFVVRRRSTNRKQEAFIKQQTTRSHPDDTLSFDHSNESQPSSINSSLLNDPIIITHRIPHNDVKVATCISRGGFGLVYSGTFNRRRVAIKRIRSELSADIKYIEAFLKEICLMASLSHPRIVEFVGVAWDSLRNLSAVTEFMERGDLRDVLHSSKTRNAPLSWDGHKARIAMHIAEALTYLHSLSPKVIHRDLKSKNVLLDTDMTAKLSDFGVSRERRFEETHMTAGIGTAFWIAPEVLLGMDYDERADIFSFGVVLSEIDTDDYPYWNEKNPASGGKQQENVILRMVATGALRPEFSPTCPAAIMELGQLCLDVDPLQRPTAAEITYRLQQLIRASPLMPITND